MRKLLLLAMLAAVGWYAHSHYPEALRELYARVSGLTAGVASLDLPGGEEAVRPAAAPLPEITKCTTADGRVIYGEVPAGTVCKQREQVGDKLTVLPREEFIGHYGSGPGQAAPPPRQNLPVLPALSRKTRSTEEGADAGFNCDGRSHCSQMTSCAEAKAFLANCPGTEMDGDGDGVPCEQQWCQ